MFLVTGGRDTGLKPRIADLVPGSWAQVRQLWKLIAAQHLTIEKLRHLRSAEGKPLKFFLFIYFLLTYHKKA